MKILVIGQSSFDITAELNEPIEENKKYRIESTFKCPGGPAFNAACLLGKWGCEVYLASRIGDDEYGRELKQYAKKRNVNLDYLIKDDLRATPYSNIFISEEKRTIFNYVEPFNEVDYKCGLEDVDIILTDGQEPKLTMEVFAKYPKAIKVMDLGSYRKERMIVAENVDYLITSKQFAESYSGLKITEENFIEVLNRVNLINNKIAVITLGEDGLLYKQDEEVINMKAFKASAIDSTGAGDIFHGSFVYCLDRGYDFTRSLKVSSMAASISTETKGSSESIPELQEVFNRLEKY